MSGAAGDGIFGNVFGGCISSDDIGIQRRPYHRNCSCALHKTGENHCSHVALDKVSYPIRRSWSEGCMVAMMAAATASAGSSPCSLSPAPSRDPPSVRLPPHIPNHQLNH